MVMNSDRVPRVALDMEIV